MALPKNASFRFPVKLARSRQRTVRGRSLCSISGCMVPSSSHTTKGSSGALVNSYTVIHEGGKHAPWFTFERIECSAIVIKRCAPQQAALVMKWEEYERKRAKERMTEGRNQFGSPPVNSPEGSGDARDLLAARADVSRNKVDQAQVLEKHDAEHVEPPPLD